MGTVDLSLARRLRQDLRLDRAVETGTYLGITARRLAEVFPAVVTIELSEQLHATAAAALRDVPQVKALQGHSVDRLPEVADPKRPALYFLDGHWSAGVTVGANDECPLLRELSAIGPGNPSDCLIVDDARLFAAPPPPPHDPAAWPTLLEVFDAIRSDRPDHHITILEDQIVAVPQQARAIVDAHGQSLLMREQQPDWRARVLALAQAARDRLRRRR
ncbi:MAG TPA: hypothetical protein VEX36_12745 [Thermoleophilaceae bacterium]|nr:hypothetical protein [Thermoleophilaceae bacterium]